MLDYAGVPGSALNPSQQEHLIGLIELFVSNLREGHARVRMEEVREHIARTHFAWIGEHDDDSAYYFRIHSPVILIEFDHQGPIGLRHMMPAGPNRDHIHAVIRTPNGNDYGKDLLRLHHEKHPHPHN